MNRRRRAVILYFYPRSPCGERQTKAKANEDRYKFLSTLSLRRATPVRDIIQWEGIFLSTLSLRRATVLGRKRIRIPRYFYPRSPCGERPLRQLQSALRRNFYPRSPCGERLAGPSGPAFLFNFYPRSPCGERP